MTLKLDDVTLAYRIAAGAGAILKGIRSGGLVRGKELGACGDELAQTWIATVLKEHRPDDGVLSEEAPDDPEERLKHDRVWIIDPLDGTREFSTGRLDWAVHVSLVENNTPVAAAVAMPDAHRVWRSDNVRAVGGPLSNKIAVSRTRPAACSDYVAEKLDAELVPMGSAGAKSMSVLLGDADAYIHSGGQHEWDSAAPVGVCQAAGLHCSRLDGSPLVYNQEDTWLPDLVICRKEIAGDILKAVAEFEANEA
ncbi:MAG: 3'(2'),5'-bisphosphate nucleotidase CysQ [Lawsonella sp.]|nr:3'(2'),5'-bisphosphate nucleotidase CysQ [Mycobacteriales bacterium]